ncbi:DUF802 domain-containing protein [Ideonella sp. A 288]|uniref:DUF802 domain-containing protein n=1 Tax=Ideonella sp. A 288 TaxID=1962181 RepID=UPI000B4BDF7A|nr:DUF802 domain-containing protein [Ideonella sp. A 288]
MNRQLCVASFVLGLVAVGWVGAGYVGSSPLALTMTLLIGAFYLMGALELRRFQQATASLGTALAAIPADLPQLGDWLGQVPAALQNPVRLRIEGERVGLPGPSMTPYLVGLLVLLGMLGTFLGMVVTLNGAVLALESTTDLPTIRAALAAPVKGLGLAFGTSVAGVAASAMLGLMSALCRRERLQAAQLLDTRIATGLRRFSLAHQRQETLDALRFQAQVMPRVADQLQAMMAAMERQGQALNERLLDQQQTFHREARTVYSDLAVSVDRSLKDSLTESARSAGATIQPVVEATMAGIARETSLLHERIAGTVQAQLEGLSARFGATVGTVSEVWTTALAAHERTSDGLAQGLRQSLEQVMTSFEQRSATLLSSVEATHSALQGEWKVSLSDLARQSTEWHERMAGTVERQLDGVSQRLGSTATDLSGAWTDAVARHQRASEQLVADLRASLATTAETFAQQSASLLATVDQTHGAWQSDLASQDHRRQAALAQSLEAMAASLQQAWQRAGEQTLGQQEHICRTLEQTAQAIQARADAQARDTIAEMAGLMHAAAEAPRAAAEVIGALRQELSDSMARDNGLLEERSRVMQTLSTLLDAVNHAATEQRGAIDSLVASSAALLQHAGTRFAEQVEAEAGRLSTAASQVTGSAIEVSSLGESFGLAVQMFGTSSGALVDSLQRIEGSLNKSMARSDEQLAYYVAQAREIIDLSILSQKQIVEELQRLAHRPVPLAAEVG